MNFGSMQQTDQFLLRILFSSAATVGLIGWNEAFRRWLWRTGRFLVALAVSICTIGSTPLLADEISSKNIISPDTVVLLLSQTAHSTWSKGFANKGIKS